MTIYGSDGREILKPGVSVDAVHEEELMKSDFVRLSWSDADRYVIRAGSYVTPYLDNIDHEGNPMRYMLFRDYVPEQIRPGEYAYKPEFQHPKMWLGYVPFLFATYDAAGSPVKKTDYEFTGDLGTLIHYICDYINEALEDVGFIGEHDDRFAVSYLGTGLNETVTVRFSDDNILSAIDKVCEATGYEYHLEWLEMEVGGQRYDQKLFYFGSIYLGGEIGGEDDEYELEIGRNIGVPKVTESKDKQYNRFYVQGGSRNNAIQGEHGNIALNTRLLLNDTEYPGSIIDTRPLADRNTPGLTGIITLDEVYPHLELYIFDLHERRKYKTDNGNVTDERWSVWYFRLAYLSDVSEGNIGTAVVDGVTKYWHEFFLKSDPKTSVTVAAASEDDPLVVIDLPVKDYGLPMDVKEEPGQERVEQRVMHIRKHVGLEMTECKVGVISGESSLELVEYFDDETALQDSKEFLKELSVDDNLEILDKIDLDELPYQNVTTHAIDGLAPSLGFMFNSNGEHANALGTREFEIRHNSTAVAFDHKDDVPGQTGVGAGYYEIIHTTEGSDGLIMPTTSEQGITPYGSGSMPSTCHSKVQLINVVIGNEYRVTAQEELATRAKVEIVRVMADQNHYTSNANPVEYESGKPCDIKIGRRIAFDDGVDYHIIDGVDYRMRSRIIRLVTKLDYDFDVEITFGNTLTKRFSDRIMAQLANLGSGTGGYDRIDITPEAQKVTTVDYKEWIRGNSYYFETLNKKTGVIETSYVWHRGKKWMCLRSLTAEEPRLGCRDWKPVEGDMTFWGEINASNGAKFHNGNVDTVLMVRIWWGSDDVTDVVTSDAGYRAEWSRLTGYDSTAREYRTRAEDLSWTPTVTGPNKILLARGDMGSGWMMNYRSALIRCRVTAACIDGVTADYLI